MSDRARGVDDMSEMTTLRMRKPLAQLHGNAAVSTVELVTVDQFVIVAINDTEKPLGVTSRVGAPECVAQVALELPLGDRTITIGVDPSKELFRGTSSKKGLDALSSLRRPHMCDAELFDSWH